MHEVDFVSDVVYLKEANQTEKLIVTAGATCCGGRPPERIYIVSREFNERAWSGNRLDGIDASGVTKDGKRWRWIGALLGESASYVGASAEGAKYFERIIASMCIAN